MTTVLIIEDDNKIGELLQKHLEKYGYSVKRVVDFSRVMESFQQAQPRLVLLDVNLPKYDGYYWCRQIRKVSLCPILFLSARSEQMDQVMALENGADDYITKPFNYEVVTAKIRSQLRRVYGDYAQTANERVLDLHGLKLYIERMEVSYGENKTMLSKKEAILLEALMKRFPKVVGRDYLLEKLWDDETFVDENTLNVNVTRVRKRLKDIGIENGIETVRGAGYRMTTNWEGAGDDETLY
ncbi:DNA-binding response OmpR family regulator [Pullulanibacillus pueri]|uniref:response regulator transcription factor n=1 Tax=Pullulanibacillus pueri TaxID=1437324 RepID=UPI0016644614|nr:response regulator transcription factor [Pullulanibacillus pueri]MBM7680675.1 DNA-binding response OmpR family regulator [Pullulanibacillus pueri]